MAEQQASAARNELSSKGNSADVKRRTTFDQAQFDRDKKEMELSKATLMQPKRKCKRLEVR